MASGIVVRIGSPAGNFETRSFASPAQVDESWVNKAIGNRRKDGLSVVIEIDIEIAGLNMRVRAPESAAGGGGRMPTPREREIFDLWDDLVLSKGHFVGGNVIAFLKKLPRNG